MARQQDFLRDLREQIDPARRARPDRTRWPKPSGHAIRSNFPASASELILLSKLVAFSQAKPLRQVKFLTTEVNAQINGGSYVTSDRELEKETLEKFLNGHEQLHLGNATSPHGRSSSHGHHASHHEPGVSPAALNLVPTSSAGESEVVQAAPHVPFRVALSATADGTEHAAAGPRLHGQGPAEQPPPRLRDRLGAEPRARRLLRLPGE